ncbi:MAG: hypothetical protein GY946_01825 [bacterium]|nr:hypothetical protein [bacterium]
MHRFLRPLTLAPSLLALVLAAGSTAVLVGCGSDEPESVRQAPPSGEPSEYGAPPRSQGAAPQGFGQTQRPPSGAPPQGYAQRPQAGGQAGNPGGTPPGGWPAPPPPGGGQLRTDGPAGGGGDPFSGRFQANAEGVLYDLELARHDQERWSGTISYGGNRIPIVGVLQGGKLVGLVNDPVDGEFGFWGSPSPEGLRFEIEDDDPVSFRRVGGAPVRQGPSGGSAGPGGSGSQAPPGGWPAPPPPGGVGPPGQQ